VGSCQSCYVLGGSYKDAAMMRLKSDLEASSVIL
jgi:hypothetical protein